VASHPCLGVGGGGGTYGFGRGKAVCRRGPQPHGRSLVPLTVTRPGGGLDSPVEQIWPAWGRLNLPLNQGDAEGGDEENWPAAPRSNELAQTPNLPQQLEWTVWGGAIFPVPGRASVPRRYLAGAISQTFAGEFFKGGDPRLARWGRGNPENPTRFH